MLAQWLNAPGNTYRIGRHLLQVMRGFLDLTDDARIQTFMMRRAVHRAIDKVDLSQTNAVLLESLTKNNRHQELLDAAINQLLRLLHKPATRDFIAMQIVRWLKREYLIKAKMLPTEWLGEHSAELVANVVDSVLDDVAADPGHELRLGFNRAVDRLIERLKHDPEMAARAEEIKT
nr:putative membrane protein [Candidatus Pantoea persica]